jgi:hypothetical protein
MKAIAAPESVQYCSHRAGGGCGSAKSRSEYRAYFKS